MAVTKITTVPTRMDHRGRQGGAGGWEYNPCQDLTDVTAIVAAKIAKEVAGRMLADAAI